MNYETNQLKFAAYAMTFGAKKVKAEVRYDKMRKKMSVFYTLSHKDITKLYDDYKKEEFIVLYYDLKAESELLLKKRIHNNRNR